MLERKKKCRGLQFRKEEAEEAYVGRRESLTQILSSLLAVVGYAKALRQEQVFCPFQD